MSELEALAERKARSDEPAGQTAAASDEEAAEPAPSRAQRSAGDGTPRDRSGFENEYDLNALITVKPAGQPFSMLVTPRYRGHYDGVEYEAFTARYLRAILRRTSLFVDVGAHYGFFSLVALSANETLRVIAAEPVAETRAILLQNLAEIGAGRVTVCAQAVSDGCETRSFQISLSSDNCSFYPHPNAQPINQILVETTSIDRLLQGFQPCPLVVKIDTDGHELAVLRGMSETLKRFDDITLVVELNPKMQKAAGFEPDRLLRQLEALGFSLFIVDEERGQSFRLRADQDFTRFMRPESYANLICLRQAKALSFAFFAHSAALNGAERSLLSLVEDLVGHRRALCTVVLPEHGPLEGLLRKAGASVSAAALPWWCCASDDPDGQSALTQRLFAAVPDYVTRLLPLMRDIDPDVIVTQTMVIPWGAAVAGALRKPHIWSVCEYGELDHDLRFVEPIDKITADIEASADFVFFAVRDIQKALFPNLPADRWDALYRHIEIPAAPDAAPEISPAGRTPRLGLFASLLPTKGQLDAIDAVAELKARGLSVELILAGGGRSDYAAALQQRVHDLGLDPWVRLIGFADDPYSVMRDCDIVLVCSRREAFGRTAVEAMLMGKPVIYSAAGGVAEYLQDGETGLAFPPGDVKALADRIETLLRDGAFAARLGQAGQNFARSAFTRENYGGKFFAKALELRAAAQGRANLPATLLPAMQFWVEEAQRRMAEMEAVKARNEALEDDLAAAQARGAELTRAVDERVSEFERLQGELARARREYQNVYALLRAARRNPLKNYRRYLKWRTSRHLLRLKPLLPQSMVAKLQKRQDKNSPGKIQTPLSSSFNASSLHRRTELSRVDELTQA